ncbi:unnamed protein product [Lactuca virosa]|uniref:Tubby C-terminal domain-containing protein n=1 Tax=Lactuca virosa TaxID=75947 RepID=A0AAU9LIQ6_9ASTR|nr:unnamed protein product [Lactuca virosa]
MRSGRLNSIKELIPLSKPPEINIAAVPGDDDVVGEQNVGGNNGREIFMSLHPGSRDSPIQCMIKRSKKNSVFYLNLAATPSFTNKGKFLLAARRYTHGAHMEYIISLDSYDSYQRSNAYVVASVKNFQLVATLDPSQPGGKGDGETVLLQFEKVGDDIFTMDYVWIITINK